MNTTIVADKDLEEVRLDLGPIRLDGLLGVPAAARGVVLFAHGTGSGRFSPRNQFVARELRAGGVGTFLTDLLTDAEEDEDEMTARLRFDIGLLTSRVLAATHWLRQDPRTRDLPIGYFGASTGAAAALRAAGQSGAGVAAIVSRGGRPDLAGEALGRVRAPTLFVVGETDSVVLQLNRIAMEQVHAEKKLVIVPGASHLFEEPGALEEVARASLSWFQCHLSAARAPGRRVA
jgi:dienelactone hydrolase